MYSMSFPKNLVTTYFLRVCNTINNMKNEKKSKQLCKKHGGRKNIKSTDCFECRVNARAMGSANGLASELGF